MERAKLTVRVPKDRLDFVKGYAKQHGLTLTELVDRYFRHLEIHEPTRIHPEVEAIRGLIPSDVDPKQEYRKHLLEKYG